MRLLRKITFSVIGRSVNLGRTVKEDESVEPFTKKIVLH